MNGRDNLGRFIKGFNHNKNNVHRTKHGMSHSRTYGIWSKMKCRCKILSHHNRNYAGRGIKVCERWKYSLRKERILRRKLSQKKQEKGNQSA
jgi:hypothetical protein